MPRWMMNNKMMIRNIMMRLKFAFSEPRWSIIKILGNETKGTNDIYGELLAMGHSIPQSTLYYHLSSLKNAGMIEMVGYREEGGGAPEKLWRLKVNKICVDLLSGEIIEKEGEEYENSNSGHHRNIF